MIDGRRVSVQSIAAAPWPRFEAQLSSGEHTIEIGNAKCQLSAHVYTVPGHDRSFMAILSHGRLIADFKNYIFGTVPLTEGHASIIDARGIETPIVLDHGVYAAEYLDTGQYILRFALPTSHMQVRVAVTVGKGANRRDITRDEIIRNVGSAFVVRAHHKLEFVPLWSTAHQPLEPWLIQ